MANGVTTRFFLVVIVLSACKPDLGDPPSLVIEPSLLAIKAEPAESVPGSQVTYSFLLAGPEGTIANGQAGWDICLSPKPPAESNSVARQCNPQVEGSVSGQTFQAQVPLQACQLFGPIAPAPEPGKPAIRPRDPDTTGGYYLPVRVRIESEKGALAGFAFERIACGVANAPATVAQQFKAAYRPNHNPTLLGMEVVLADGSRQPLNEGEVVVGVGSTVHFEAGFPDSALETFPVYDAQSESLQEKRESLTLFWFATSGVFENDRTGVSETAIADTSANRWTAGNVPGTVHMWIVLRDSRGGSDFRAFDVRVATMP